MVEFEGLWCVLGMAGWNKDAYCTNYSHQSFQQMYPERHSSADEFNHETGSIRSCGVAAFKAKFRLVPKNRARNVLPWRFLKSTFQAILLSATW